MKKGDKVRFNARYGMDRIKGRDVHTVTSEPWKAGKKELVLLDGKSGGWCTDGLEETEGKRGTRELDYTRKILEIFWKSRHS